MDTTTPLHPAPPPPLQLRSAPIRMAARWSLGHWASGIGGFILYGFFAVVSGAYGFSLVLGLLTSGAATVIVWIGLPLLVAGVSVARGFASAERAVQRTVLGSELPTPSPKPSPAGVGAMRRLRTPLDDLTAREREVLELMGEGLTNAGIAERLFISNGAVEKHTQRLFAKLGLSPDASVHRRVSAVLTLLGR